MNADTDKSQINKIYFYQLMVVFSVVFALVGFSYNVWRMEVTEENDNIRTASFEILLELASLEQLIYAAHYDKDKVNGSPRKGWVIVGLVNDLSVLAGDSIQADASTLKLVWSNQWEHINNDVKAVKQIIEAIDNLRSEIKQVLIKLE